MNNSLTLSRKGALRVALSFALAFALLTAGSKISLSIGPVPITMQTFAVVMVGFLMGRRLAPVAVAAWLAAGFAGMPVFSSVCGPAALIGPTAGFLLSFPLIAAMAGCVTVRNHALTIFGVFLAANLACLAIGWAWLALSIGALKAFMVGVAPFVAGAVLKSLLGMLLIVALRR